MHRPRPFRFGVINEQTMPAECWIQHVQRAEALGYASFLIRDHLVPDFFGEQLAPLPALMAAAMATTTIHVGTMVLANDFRHPAMLAKEAATVQQLSGGRLELGIGAGWLQREYQVAGLPYESAGTRIERLEESLQVLRGLWDAAPFSFAGKHYQIDGLTSFPNPGEPIPLLVGGGKPRMLRLAGRHADIVGLLTTSVATGVVEDDPAERLAATVEQKIGWVREGAGARFDEIELSLIPTIVRTDNRRAWAEQMLPDRGWNGITVDDVLDMPSIFAGTDVEIEEQMLARRERYGISYYVVSDKIMDDFAPLVSRLAER